MLSNRDILKALQDGHIAIDPLNYANLQPNSFDLRLGEKFIRELADNRVDTMRRDARRDELGLWLRPDECVLMATLERVRVSPGYSAVVFGRSTWARRFIQVESAGLVDAGFGNQTDGNMATLTLEIKNLSTSNSVWLPFGERICQIVFFRLDTPASPAYGDPELGSHYQGQQDPTRARE